ncbi:type II toxin-antitoxin system VapC family toxin [Polaromonas sp. JS666]|uniref:type II toxin-antitoxin system VapC family toxin n=1 Tax=Polaromonas sp. (strain JS666 / ATCC BAA-500) TaxID=296591 RepID=UPI0012ED0F05|nr:type II toxin-antitoxin system VapC family toxin [Polaromonas sp. JS666]
MNLLSDYLPSGQPVLDASVIINLLGTKEPVAIFDALGHKCLIEQRTLREVCRHPVPGLLAEPVLADLISRDLLEVVRMTDDEYEVYLSYVSPPLGTRLDDGESAALAVAGRGACVVIDERRARRRAAAAVPNIIVVSTLRLVLTSAHRAGWGAARAKSLVEQAIHHSRMAAPKEEAALLASLLQPTWQPDLLVTCNGRKW